MVELATVVVDSTPIDAQFLTRDTPTAAPTTPLPTPLLPTAKPPTPNPPAPKIGISADDSIPDSIITQVMDLTETHSDRFAWGTDEVGAQSAHITVGGETPLVDWIFAVASPFATVIDHTTMEEVRAGWQTGVSAAGNLILSETTAAAFSALWGPPSPSVQIVEHDHLVELLWAARPSWTLIPFDELVPELKVLKLDGQSPLDKQLDINTYPLSIPIGMSGDSSAARDFLAIWGDVKSNRDPGMMTRIAMSGVTALSRATAYQMELRGVTVPGEVVGPILRDADFAHISHEVSFAADCTYPNPIGDAIFCARDKYLELLTSIGTDVVELTGNHLNDWGAGNSARSIDMYQEAGMQTFGGGRDLGEANQPLLIEHNGNKIAFVGCNPVGPPGGWATEYQSGSLPCSYEAFYAQIQNLQKAGYQVIATLQYAEYYQYAPTANQQADFRALIDAGAAAVSGSQGHHAQGFDLYEGAFIHYGLGNLFFDQMDMLGTRQSFIDNYVFYDGELISVELYTSLIEDYCCPREMTAEERAEVLELVFQASGW
jgi:poly-gamma-glutamate synthesis protein (capsule biosynthesis protein)